MAKRVRARRVRAYVGLGANVGDTRANLRHAVRAMTALPGVRVRGVSRLYRTRPVGMTDQPDFLNAVVALDVPAGPDFGTGALALLSVLKVLEAAIGRKVRGRWGPREIDLDLLVFGRHRIKVERPHTQTDKHWLEVPHPEMRERLFVLAPMADLAPWLVPVGWGESVETARRRAAALAPENAVQVVGKL